jgi:FixJ family two-component response regulator
MDARNHPASRRREVADLRNVVRARRVNHCDFVLVSDAIDGVARCREPVLESNRLAEASARRWKVNTPMVDTEHLVYVVDDDVRVREAMLELLNSFRLHATALASASEYMAAPKVDVPSCLVLDVVLPGIDGLELQRRVEGQYHPPIIFITGNPDVPSAVEAMRGGAIDFLMKPFSDEALIGSVRKALEQDRQDRLLRAELARLRKRYDTLTPRESQVLTLVVAGLLNKQSASELGISQVTLQAHRGKVMEKMAARSLPDLVRMASRLDIAPWTTSARFSDSDSSSRRRSSG